MTWGKRVIRVAPRSRFSNGFEARPSSERPDRSRRLLSSSQWTLSWSKADSNLYGAFPVKWLFWVLLRVLCSEVRPGKASMFSRRQSCRGKSQSPVVRIAEEMETEPSKPIDKISRGENTSHRAVSKENALWPRKK